MRFEQTLGNGKIKIKNNSKTKNTLHLFCGKTQNEIGKATQTCPQGTILAGQKINGNSIHKSRKRLDFEARRKEAAHELKSSRKQLSEGNKPGNKLESLAKISDKAKCYRLKQVIICYRTTISRA